MKIQSENLLGYTVCSDNLKQFEEKMNQQFDTFSRVYISCINPHSYITAKDSIDFQNSLKLANVLIPDGSGIVLASTILKGHIKERITGSDLFLATNKVANQKSSKYFFIGSSVKILNEIEAKLNQEFPNIQVVGKYSPPYVKALRFSAEINEDIIKKINETKPDVIWVGLSAPKQEVWILDNMKSINDFKLIAPIGAVFDFYTGNIKRSPKIFRDLHLEWLPRLMQEPKRLFKRNFVSSPLFLADIFKNYYFNSK